MLRSYISCHRSRPYRATLHPVRTGIDGRDTVTNYRLGFEAELTFCTIALPLSLVAFDGYGYTDEAVNFVTYCNLRGR